MEQTTEATSIFEQPKRLTFILICLATLTLLFVKKSMIENETAAFEFLANQQEGSVLFIRSALQYFTIPLVYGIKFTFLGLVIWIGCFLFGYRVTFSQCWGIVILSEFVFLLPELIKIFWFLAIRTDPNFYEIQAYYPLSVMNLLDYQSVSPRFAYLYKSLNLFEPLYWFALALGIAHFSKRGMKPAWTIVLGFYVPVYAMWLIFYVIVYR